MSDGTKAFIAGVRTWAYYNCYIAKDLASEYEEEYGVEPDVYTVMP